MQNEKLNLTVDKLISMGKRLLSESGKLITTGAALDTQGQLTLMPGTDGTIEPNSLAGATLVVNALRKQSFAGSLRCGAVMTGVVYAPPGVESSEAIRIIAEHQDGEGAEIFVPFKRGWFGRNKYGEMVENPWQNKLFFPAT
jgi:hypothetical protein